jgi:hypothetical protein
VGPSEKEDNDGLRKAWKNDETVFPPFPQTLEIASQRFPHSQRPDDHGMKISQTFNVQGVGQNKLPKWAKPACQTHWIGQCAYLRTPSAAIEYE